MPLYAFRKAVLDFISTLKILESKYGEEFTISQIRPTDAGLIKTNNAAIANVFVKYNISRELIAPSSDWLVITSSRLRSKDLDAFVKDPRFLSSDDPKYHFVVSNLTLLDMAVYQFFVSERLGSLVINLLKQ